ncbi:hypothetical protein C465_07038 [Halorubrum distributum JCM 9100]|uniref:DUF4382 domain-containing protein n=2 Tax=Halorubrum distributum TaxID=29283 RepID=M0ES09_9EURY|nr:DUF4382 domain-containing protein [Halorubrum distributum]ELZ49687.1 hypothetical protein C465_07038 [Halorubrum distributum JCM 9100]ELZ56969.1 hypothetical protein C466_02689 [Halorubrum distributum JCM 10118]
MTDRSQTTGENGSRTTGDDRSTGASTDGLGRRKFVALGAGASATLLAGCAGDGSLPTSGGSDGSDGSDGSQTLTGNFRLLISDAPADIDDFDRLDVTLDRARIFEAGDGDDEDDEDAEDEEDDENADEDDGSDDDTEQNATETDDDANETADEDDDANETDVDDGGDDEEDVEAEDEDGEDEDGEDDDEEDRGFTVVELDGATVDLTQVVEDDAIAVFDGEIPAGSYEKIELEVSAVEGIVDGSEVDVKLPSEKLQITNGFEVTPDEEVSFVFDINVVKRGKNNGYILKPVISGSGVAGRDVDVNEIDDDDDDEGSEDDEEDGEDSEDDATGGNETDEAENETASGS